MIKKINDTSIITRPHLQIDKEIEEIKGIDKHRYLLTISNTARVLYG